MLTVRAEGEDSRQASEWSCGKGDQTPRSSVQSDRRVCRVLVFRYRNRSQQRTRSVEQRRVRARV